MNLKTTLNRLDIRFNFINHFKSAKMMSRNVLSVLLVFFIAVGVNAQSSKLKQAKRMMDNLNRTGGLCFSEAVMLALVKAGLPRQRAYEMVQQCALAAHRGDGNFRDLLAAHQGVSERLGEDELEATFDLQHHLRHVDTIMKRTLGETL